MLARSFGLYGDGPIEDPDKVGAALRRGIQVVKEEILAFRDSGKVCINIQKDGDFLYTSSSLWTAAHHNIPMLVVMFNNKAYYQDEGHQMAVAKQRNRSLDTIKIGIGLEEPETRAPGPSPPP